MRRRNFLAAAALSALVACGDDGLRGGARVQYVPAARNPVPDPIPFEEKAQAEEFVAGNWTQRANPKSLNLEAICWDGNQFIATGQPDGTDAYVLTSPDGALWTERSNPKAKTLFGVESSGSLTVAVGDADTDAYVVTSSDGITWTERTTPAKVFFLSAVTWVPWLSLWVAVGQHDATDGYILTSPDGITWTERANAKALTLWSVAHSPKLGLVVAVGSPDTDAYILSSTDGITWTERAPTTAKVRALLSVIWFDKPGSGSQPRFIACGDADTGDAYMVSSFDGVTWDEVANPKNIQLLQIATGSVIAIASGGSGSTPYTITSRDGANWAERENLSNAVFVEGVAWNGRRFVMVGGTDGTKALILTSLNV